MAGVGGRVRALCWNVNGIRACVRKGMPGWWRRCRPDFMALQEVRARPEQVPEELTRTRYHKRWSVAERPGYSGVGLLSKREPDEVYSALAPRFDVEGRMVVARYGRLWLCSAYFPKSAGRNRDNSRLSYKLDFSRTLRAQLEPLLQARERVLVLGDFNVAHQPIDLARPRQNQKNSGYLPEERDDFEGWLSRGWVDTFRHLESGAGHYTWWPQRGDLRERNVGWRIDYVLASPRALEFVEDAFIQPTALGSDHAPLGVTLRADIMDT